MFDWYPIYERDLARLQLICFMLGMGATLRADEFIEIVRRPYSMFSALVGQLFILPWLAVAINVLARLDHGIAIGMILVSLMPGGAMSKIFTYLGKGNVALSISLSAVGTLASLFTVPLLLQVLASRYIPEDFEMPVVEITIEVALCLVAPLLVGMVVARIWRSHRLTFSTVCVRLGMVLVLAIVVGSLGSQRIKPLEYGLGLPIAIILFCVLGQQLNMLPFYLLKMPRADRMSAGVEATMRNMNLALLIKTVLFRPDDPLGDGVLFVILFYAGAAMATAVPLVLNHRRLARREVPVLTTLEPLQDAAG